MENTEAQATKQTLDRQASSYMLWVRMLAISEKEGRGSGKAARLLRRLLGLEGQDAAVTELTRHGFTYSLR
jgi:hypothetical protein